MSIYYRSLIQDGYLLDMYPNASVAYSLRKLKSSYNGPAIEVRRSSDNTLLDVNFLPNGELDTQSCLDFVGYNLSNYSQDFSNDSWAKTGINITGTYVNIGLSPDGTTTADKMIENTSNSTHRTTKGFKFTSGQYYNQSIYLKAGERRYVQLLSSVGVANQIMNIDLQTGTIITNTFTSARLTSIGDGWYRFDADLLPTTTASATLLISLQTTSAGTLTYSGDGASGVYIWGFQISYGTGVKPYITTVATTAGTGFIETWYDQSGNLKDANQGTYLSQWHIVLNSQITTNSLTGRICARIAQNGFYQLKIAGVATNISVTSPHFMVGAYYFNGTNAFTLFGNRNVGGSPKIIYQTSTGISYKITNSGSDDLNNSFNTAGNYITTSSRVVNDLNIYINNNFISNRNTSFSGTNISITNIGSFASSGNIGPGDVFEMIFWNQNYTVSRADITNKINYYYGFY